MLADAGGGAPVPDRCRRQLGEGSWVGDPIDLDPVVAGDEVLVGDEVGRVPRGGHQPAAGDRTTVDLGLGAGPEEGDELIDAALAVGRAQLTAEDQREQLGPVDRRQVVVEGTLVGRPGHHAAEAAGAGGAEHEGHAEEAVGGAGEHGNLDAGGARWRGGPVVAHTRRVLVERGVAGHEQQGPGDRGLEGGVEVLAEARPSSLVQDHDRVGRGLHRPAARRLRWPDRHGRSVAIALAVQEPAGRRQGEVGRRAGRLGPGLAERGHRHVHEGRVDRGDRGGVEAEGGHHARGRRLDEHVGTRGQVAQRRPPVVVGQVEHDAALAQAPGLPEQRTLGVALAPVDERRHESRGAPAGRLDLDHLGTQVGENPPGRLGQRPGEVEHPEVGEGTSGEVVGHGAAA